MEYPEPTSTPPWWRRITGRRALSWQVVVFGTLLTYPQIVLTGGTLGSRPVQPEEFPTIATVIGIAAVIAVSFAGLAQLTFMRNRSVTPIPLWVYFGFYMTAGFIYATGMEISDNLVGAEAVIPWPIRYLFAGVTTVGWGVLISLILDSQDRFRESRESLIAERVRRELITLRESAEVEQIRSSLDSSVRDELRTSREALARAISSSAQPEAIAALVRDTAEHSVRALSHELHEQATKDFPRPRVAGIARQVLRHPRFLPLATTVLIAIGLPGAAIRAFGPSLAPIAIIAVAGVIFAITYAGNIVMSALPRLRQVIFILGTVLTVGVVVAFAMIPGAAIVPAAEAASIVIGVTSAVVVAAFVAALSDVRSRVLESLRGDIVDQLVAQVAYREELGLALRETAASLHGSVQTRLIACAAAIEIAARDDDVVALAQALEEATIVLNGDSSKSSNPSTLGEQVAGACDPWIMLCDISTEISPDIARLPAVTGLDNVIEEALANAYRHGNATTVTVAVQATSEDMIITVTDDGVGPKGGPPGLGTAALRRLTADRFVLESVNDRTRLTALVPRQAATTATEAEYTG